MAKTSGHVNHSNPFFSISISLTDGARCSEKSGAVNVWIRVGHVIVVDPGGVVGRSMFVSVVCVEGGFCDVGTVFLRTVDGEAIQQESQQG